MHRASASPQESYAKPAGSLREVVGSGGVIYIEFF